MWDLIPQAEIEPRTPTLGAWHHSHWTPRGVPRVNFLKAHSRVTDNLIWPLQQLELHMEQQTGSNMGKEYFKAVYSQPAYLTYKQSTSWEMLCWMKHKLESRVPGEISTTSDMQVDTTLMAESKEELKSLLMKGKEEREKVGWKLNIQKTNFMASGPITSWQIDGETGEAVTDFIWGGSKITADGDCSHEIKRCLLLGRKVITILDSILKSRDINCQQRFI